MWKKILPGIFFFIKNVGSSTSHKKTLSLRLSKNLRKLFLTLLIKNDMNSEYQYYEYANISFK